MATQPSYVTELTATTSQQQQPPASAPPPAGTAPFGAELPGGTAPGAPPPAPPAPAPPPQQFIVVTVAGEHPKTAAVCSKNPPSLHPLLLGVQQLPPVQHVFPAPVSYVEGGDGSYPPGAIPAPPRRPPPPASSQAPPASAPVPMYVAGGQILGSPPAPPQGSSGTPGAPGGGTYVIQGGYMGGGGRGLCSHHPRLPRHGESPVQWLLDNYETAEGVSLPRSALYCHYLLHCQGHKLEPVNAASFGKLIRSVFMGLRTRRLGTRGNSKYHYYGLRIKAGSPLLRLVEDQQHLAMRQQPFAQKQRRWRGGSPMGCHRAQPPPGVPDISAQVQQYQQFLDASRTLPEFPEIDVQGKGLPEGAGAEDLRVFQQLYREHCEAIVDVMINLQFSLVETLWKSFWRCSGETEAFWGDPGPPSRRQEEAERRLPRRRLLLLARHEPVLRWVRDCDHALYQGLVEILVPDVLRPIPSALTQAIRNFAKSLESWLGNAMVTAAGAFAQTLRRYTSLNHLAQAARAVLQNTAQISQMLSDLNRVDFANVQVGGTPNGAGGDWVSAWVCSARVVQRLEQDFKATLGQQHSLEQWAAWLDAVVGRVLRPHLGTPGLPRAAKLFLLKWSFYSSMVIRDLTLRSAASFGSFHLIRLLYDEYMYYLVEQRVARARGTCPIAVMGEVGIGGARGGARGAQGRFAASPGSPGGADQCLISVMGTGQLLEGLWGGDPQHP
uniref:Regulatory factor X1 n=1 Tax=Corvus moneduloides TaxID=1196302 RepID=A0A8C3DTH0_CORMO